MHCQSLKHTRPRALQKGGSSEVKVQKEWDMVKMADGTNLQQLHGGTELLDMHGQSLKHTRPKILLTRSSPSHQTCSP